MSSRLWSTTTTLSRRLLVPPTGDSLRSLCLEAHHGWYSWAIASLTGSCYTFGFILMTPQLFINHHLKSVSHLPWRFLCFRFINTFIDDLFAFIIRMPTMHRLSCFRDDLVFFIYLYQVGQADSSRHAHCVRARGGLILVGRLVVYLPGAALMPPSAAFAFPNHCCPSAGRTLLTRRDPSRRRTWAAEGRRLLPKPTARGKPRLEGPYHI